MVKGRVSIIIPDRNGQPYLQKTVDGLLENAGGDIEIIVVSDGTWPDPPLKKHERVNQIYHGTHFNNIGMRDTINRGMALSTGEYVMKIDEHCMVDRGFDSTLKADCDENWVVIPRRYRLLGDEWKVEEYDYHDGILYPQKGARPPVDYMYLAYPYERRYDKTCGLHGAKDDERQKERLEIPIDDVMSMQGSCYFMTKKHWDYMGDLDSEKYGQFTQEAQEIGNKTWLGGGRMIVNKKTWYAHMHKGKKGKGYGFSNEQYRVHMAGMEKGRLFCIDYYVNNKHLEDPKMIHPFEYLLEKFWPVPTWPENWKYRLEEDKKYDYSTLRQQEGTI